MRNPEVLRLMKLHPRQDGETLQEYASRLIGQDITAYEDSGRRRVENAQAAQQERRYVFRLPSKDRPPLHRQEADVAFKDFEAFAKEYHVTVDDLVALQNGEKLEVKGLRRQDCGPVQLRREASEVGLPQVLDVSGPAWAPSATRPSPFQGDLNSQPGGKWKPLPRIHWQS